MRSVVELSNQARRRFEQVKFEAVLASSTRTTLKQDPHIIPFPEFATKDHEMINEQVKHQMSIVAETMEKMARAELLEDELYEKKLQESLAKNKVNDPDTDPDL